MFATVPSWRLASASFQLDEAIAAQLRLVLEAEIDRSHENSDKHHNNRQSIPHPKAPFLHRRLHSIYFYECSTQLPISGRTNR